MYLVSDLYQKYDKQLGLQLLAGHQGLKRRILLPEVHRPGLALTGYLKNYPSKRLLLFGQLELRYLRDLNKSLRYERLQKLLRLPVPVLILSKDCIAPKELRDLCNQYSLPLLLSNIVTMTLFSKLILLLSEEFAPSVHLHGTFVEVFGVGVLIQGASAAGKSEAGLGLLERGHRLVSDDLVKVRKKDNSYLEGSGMELSRHHMEIRGIGIINVAHLYGAICVAESKKIDIVVKLEAWDDTHFYDRIGMDEKYCEILDLQVPLHLLPIKPGRDVVLLLETLALNHRLKQMGYHSAKEFNLQLLEKLKKQRSKRISCS